MNDQYNFSIAETPPVSRSTTTVLALDSGSPIVSIALSIHREIVAVRSIEQRQSSGNLLQEIDEVLRTHDLRLDQIDLLLALRGPGSFTGLRVGLATLQGMHFALGLRVGTLPTMQVLASLASADATRVICCVDAMRGAWLTQEFSPQPPFVPLAEPTVATTGSSLCSTPAQFIGFGTTGLRQAFPANSSAVFIEPGPLAPQAIRALEVCPPDLDPETLASPLYFRPPAATLPSRVKG